MSHIDIVSRIQERFPQLRRSEQKVAQMILDDLSFAATASITELAEKAGVSEASITRVAKGLGVQNVRVLKMQLAQSIAVGERFIKQTSTKQAGIREIYDDIQRALDINSRLIQQESLDACIKLIKNAGQMLIVGVGGGSTFMAQECQNRFHRLGVHCNANSDPMMMRMMASGLDKYDVLLCLSMTGFSPDVKATAELAKQYGAKVIVISPEYTELFTIADQHLPIMLCESDYIYKPTASRYVLLAAIDVLATHFAAQQPEAVREKLRRIKHNLDHHRNGHKYLPLGD